MEGNKKEAKLIFNLGVGRALIRAGCTVVDIKPDKSNHDKTVLVFKNDEIFQREFSRINEELNDSLKKTVNDEPSETCHE